MMKEQLLIQLKDVSASYGDKQVLHDVNLNVYDYDYLGVLGPNGGGKTTLMRLILGLMKPDTGSISYYKDSKPVERLSIGYLPQYNQIDRDFPISVQEVVRSGLDNRRHLFGHLSPNEKRHLESTLQRMELSELRHKPIGSLSGGQVQRALLARAIVSCPDVLILDEPNTYIDKRFQEQMYQMLHDLNKECAIILVSHDIASTLQNVKHLACVNHTLHYHEHTDLPQETLEEHFLSI